MSVLAELELVAAGRRRTALKLGPELAGADPR